MGNALLYEHSAASPNICACYAIGACLVLFVTVWLILWLLNRRYSHLYFDSQDYFTYGNKEGHLPPASTETKSFAPLIPHYLGVFKILITVAAASITFGGNPAGVGAISAAKIILAFSILYGVFFCASMLYMYDEYSQNVQAYARRWYCTVEGFGFSSVICFGFGYAVWAYGLR
jgi:hypothetical protein